MTDGTDPSWKVRLGLSSNLGLVGPSAGGPEDDDTRFARNMLTRREEKGISQADLVKALRDNGWSSVHQTTISRIEKGERPVRLGEARVIAEALGVELIQLLLTPDDSKLALELAAARERLESVRQAIKNRTVDYFKAQRQLLDAVSRGVASGIEPMEGTRATGFTSSGSAQDELALGQGDLHVSPEDAVQWGRWQYRYMQSRGEEPSSLQIGDGIVDHLLKSKESDDLSNGFDVWSTLDSLTDMYRSSVRASAPVGDDSSGYFVNVKGMEPEELAERVLGYTADTENLAHLAAAAIAALVLRDYQQPDDA
jgi:transcriptional regulator with XRE-family HTH domain